MRTTLPVTFRGRFAGKIVLSLTLVFTCSNFKITPHTEVTPTIAAFISAEKRFIDYLFYGIEDKRILA